MHFDFATAGRVLFGRGRITSLGALSASLGTRALLVCGQDSRRTDPIATLLGEAGINITRFSVGSEPTVALVAAGVGIARQEGCDLVICCGGGSVIDAGKAIAALVTNAGPLLDYLEVVGSGRPLRVPSLPLIAVPTTAGTGAEVTANAVLASPEHRVKVSLRSPLMLPTIALIDPDLSATMPPAITASTGLDALTQVIEPFVSLVATPLTDALCLDGMARIARSLPLAWTDGSRSAAREDMALGSLYGGLALANAKLGAVHGIAGPFGGMFQAPHGAVCAALLPRVMTTNIHALERHSSQAQLERYALVARQVTGETKAEPLDGPRWIAGLCQRMGIPGLAVYGCSEKDIPQLAANAARASSMKGNPVQLSEEEISTILLQSL